MVGPIDICQWVHIHWPCDLRRPLRRCRPQTPDASHKCAKPPNVYASNWFVRMLFCFYFISCSVLRKSMISVRLLSIRHCMAHTTFNMASKIHSVIGVEATDGCDRLYSFAIWWNLMCLNEMALFELLRISYIYIHAQDARRWNGGGYLYSTACAWYLKCICSIL